MKDAANDITHLKQYVDIEVGELSYMTVYGDCKCSSYGDPRTSYLCGHEIITGDQAWADELSKLLEIDIKDRNK